MKNKLFPVLKATMTGDMSIFRIKNQSKGKTKLDIARKIILIIFLFGILLISFGSYAYMFAEQLHKVNLTYIVITLFAFITSIMLFIQGIYQSQGILFDAKDNDILFSMPIKKKVIFASRLIKLLYFQYVWDFLIMVPAFAVYAFFEKPEFTFYISALIIFICLPIIPIIAISIIGYLIQGFASKFKLKRIVQVIFTLGFMLLIFGFSFNLKNWIKSIAENATSINGAILKIYYPIGIYEQCLTNFSIPKLIYVLLGNLAIMMLFIYIFSISYFKIISKLSEKSSKSNYKIKEMKVTSKFKALLKKEIKRYFGSPVYVMNTIFGPAMLLLAAVYLLFSKSGFEQLLQNQMEGVDLSILPKIILVFLMFIISMTTTTSSSISLEGKSFSLTKSLPIKTKQIFLAKMLVNILIMSPVALVCVIPFAIKLNMTTLDIIYYILISIIMPILISIIGLIVNLKFPILDAKSDTVIVKQSVSSMIAVFSGLGISMLPVVIYFIAGLTNLNLYCGILIGIYTLATIILWKVLNTYGIKKFNELNT